ARHRRVRVLGRPAALLRLLDQRLVVLLCRLERIRADDRLARIVAIAVPPRGRRRRVVAYHSAAGIRAPLFLARNRAVAAKVARIAPQVPILVEIFRREEIDRERLDAFRRLAVAGGANQPAAGIPLHAGPDDLVLAKVRRHRGAAADTDKIELSCLLSSRRSPEHGRHGHRRRLPSGCPHPSSWPLVGAQSRGPRARARVYIAAYVRRASILLDHGRIDRILTFRNQTGSPWSCSPICPRRAWP